MGELAKSIQSLVDLIADPNVQRAVVILFVMIAVVIGIEVISTLKAESQRKKARNAQRDKKG